MTQVQRLKRMWTTADMDDIFNVQHEPAATATAQREQTGAAGPTSTATNLESGLQDYPARQLKKLHQQLNAQIDARKLAIERGDVQVLGECQGRSRVYTLAFDKWRDVNDIASVIDNDEGIARLMRARDMVTTAEDYLRICQRDTSVTSHSSEAAAMVSLLANDVKDIMLDVPRLVEPRHPPPPGRDEQLATDIDDPDRPQRAFSFSVKGAAAFSINF